MKEWPAKYKGQCPNGDEILPGQEVTWVGEEVWHVECVAHSGRARTHDKFQGTTLEDMGIGSKRRNDGRQVEQA